nr:PREDICTED: uncharacterized protein LOC109035865 [Bemisia tabaci]
MIFAVISSAASTLASVAKWAIPWAISATEIAEIVIQLLKELELLRKDRQVALNGALGDRNFMREPSMIEFLSILSFIDSLFEEYYRYHDAMNTLLHSDENSGAAHEAMETIKRSKQRSSLLNELIKSKGERLSPPNISVTGQIDHLQTLFKSSLEKIEAIGGHFRSKFNCSSLPKHIKDMSHITEGEVGVDNDTAKIIEALFCYSK